MALLNNKEIGRRISTMRKDAEKTQGKMAEELNIGRSTLAKWETGDASIGIQEAAILAEYFNISIDELLTGNKPEHAELTNTLGLSSKSIENLQRISRCAAGKFTKNEQQKYMSHCPPLNSGLSEEDLEGTITEFELLLNRPEEETGWDREELENEIEWHKKQLYALKNSMIDYSEIIAGYAVALSTINYILEQDNSQDALYNLGGYLMEATHPDGYWNNRYHATAFYNSHIKQITKNIELLGPFHTASKVGL